MNGRAFFDSNILVYLAQDPTKAAISRKLLLAGGVISVQVLNEFAHVSRRKLALNAVDILALEKLLTGLCDVLPLTLEHHHDALRIADRYGFGLYDALIIAAALSADCSTLYTEDFQTGQTVDGRLNIVNPYA